MYNRTKSRQRRKRRIRGKISGSSERPRLVVFRSLKHIYAQVVDDAKGCTLASSSSAAKGFAVDGSKTESAKKVGASLAQTCLSKGIEKVVFDRGGYLYHGRVKAVAEAAREAGLKF